MKEQNCTSNRTRVCYQDSGEYVGYVYALTPLCVVGTILNLFNLVVFRSKSFRVKSCTVNFLVALAVSDLICLVIATPMGAVRCLDVVFLEWGYAARQIYETVFLPLLNTFAAASVWLTMAISIER